MIDVYATVVFRWLDELRGGEALEEGTVYRGHGRLRVNHCAEPFLVIPIVSTSSLHSWQTRLHPHHYHPLLLKVNPITVLSHPFVLTTSRNHSFNFNSIVNWMRSHLRQITYPLCLTWVPLLLHLQKMHLARIFPSSNISFANS